MKRDQPLWRPTAEAVARSNMADFMQAVDADWNVTIDDTGDLHRFSVAQPEKFWTSFRDWAGLVAETWGLEVLVDGDAMPGARWFPGARLNVAETLLQRRDDTEALVFRGEDRVARRLTWARLNDQVARFAAALQALGVAPGDRVAGYLPNLPETVIAAFAAASLGAVWSSCSPDFGPEGVLDRFGQIGPKVLVAADGYFYKGRAHDRLPALAEIAAGLPTVEAVVVVPYVTEIPSLIGIPGALHWDAFLRPHPAGPIRFERLPFDHPLYILFSSGTTGKPKCIVHGAGGTLLQHVKEHRLHCDVKPGDRLFYYTTCGWMMWNWLISGLASQATLLLYDGSPFHPGPEVLFDFAETERATLFGTSAKYLDALRQGGLEPGRGRDLSALRTLTSTGAPLATEGFEHVHASIKADLHVASISGGTDIIGCFVLGDPTRPVWAGEIQGPGLGMAVDVVDADGRSLPPGHKGELVCRQPFPSMPVGFWNDADGARYRAAYFERFPGLWHHGDFAEWTGHGGMIIHGRSDSTLNPGGVRIGTAEIYRQVEQVGPVVECLAVGQQWQGDERIVLFVVLHEGVTLDDGLAGTIRERLREHCSPRHVPARIVQVADLPRTRNAKLSERAVADVIHGRPVPNAGALLNPEALDLFRDLPELAT